MPNPSELERKAQERIEEIKSIFMRPMTSKYTKRKLSAELRSLGVKHPTYNSKEFSEWLKQAKEINNER